MFKKLSIAFLTAVVLTGCSTFNVTKVTPENSADLEGIRFNLPTPYLLVAEKDVILDGQVITSGETKTVNRMALPKKSLDCSLVYLPNPNEEYVINTRRAAGLEIEIVDGWRLVAAKGRHRLTQQLPSTVKAPSEKTIGALTGMMDLTPGMYSFVYKNGGLKPQRKIDLVRR